MLLIEPYLLLHRIVSDIGKRTLIDYLFPIVPVTADIEAVLMDNPAIGAMDSTSGILMWRIIETRQGDGFSQIYGQFVREWRGFFHRGMPIRIRVGVSCPPGFEAF